MNTGNNPLGAYLEGAFRAAITSCFIGGRISEQQIDFVKEVVSRFQEAEIDHLSLPDSEREEMKNIFGCNFPRIHCILQILHYLCTKILSINRNQVNGE